MMRIARILFLDSLSNQGVPARPEWTPWKPFVHETVPATVCCLIDALADTEANHNLHGPRLVLGAVPG